MEAMNPSVFPWDRLPREIQLSILSLLPISALIRCTTLSKSWRCLIQSDTFTASYSSSSDEDLYFLFADHANKLSPVYSYNPHRDCWISTLHFKLPASHSVYFTTSSFIIARKISGQLPAPIMVMDPFTGSVGESPIIPCTLFSNINDCEKMRNVIDTILSPTNPAVCPVFLDGLLFYLSGPTLRELWTYDGSLKQDLQVCFPHVMCPDLVAFDGGLFLVGGVEEYPMIGGVGIWELDRSSNRKEWRLVCFMPCEVFAQFGYPELHFFDTASRKGKICFYNQSTSCISMCDLKTNRWWLPSPPPPLLSMAARRGDYWRGYAVEPHIDLVKQLVGRHTTIQLS